MGITVSSYVSYVNASCILNLNSSSRDQKDIFCACIKWAYDACVQNSVEATPRNLRAKLGQCFAHIKLNFMTPIEFVRCERACPLCTFDEYKNIINSLINEFYE